MSDTPAAHECPACGKIVREDEDYVVAKEYRVDSEVQLHLRHANRTESVERRFHVGHFRGRLGECFYELLGTPEQPQG